MVFTRGDTYKFYFQRLDANGDVIQVRANEVWFTVKKDFVTTTCEIQKKLSDGTITYDPSDYTYHITIQPEDTANFEYNTDYVYDIQILQDSVIKTISKGSIKVQPEVTFERSIS